MADNRYTTRQDAEEALDYELANSCDGYPNDYDVEAIQDAVIKSDTTEGGAVLLLHRRRLRRLLESDHRQHKVTKKRPANTRGASFYAADAATALSRAASTAT